MRTLLAIGLMLGCGNSQPALVAADAQRFDALPPVGDAAPYFCDAAGGTAQVTLVHGGTTTFARVHAGGTWLVGPVAPVSGAAMTVELLFTDADHVPGGTASCCATTSSGCCSLDGVLASSGTGLAPGTEIGTHAFAFSSFQDPTFMATGTVTITGFVQPFEHAPGHIAGTISATVGADSLTGGFDNAFCAALLTETI